MKFPFTIMIRSASICALTFLLLAACDAPRQNPFDPRAENYQTKTHSTITVRRLYPPHQGIEEVMVMEGKLNLFGKTNASGVVEWIHEPCDSLVVMVYRQGYFPQTPRFLANGRNNSWDIFLNAIPQIVESKFYSIRDNALNLTSVGMEAKINDPDGLADIETVYLNLQQTPFNASLKFDFQTEKYSTQFYLNKLPGNVSDEELPARNFDLVVKNVNGDSLVSTPHSIRRVIKDHLKPLLPNPDRSESGSILFTWEKLNLTYYHFYTVILYRLSANPRQIGAFGPISSEQDQYLLDNPAVLEILTEGDYVWFLQVEDRIGNRGESNGVSFHYYK